jgi:hypothetical protein
MMVRASSSVSRILGLPEHAANHFCYSNHLEITTVNVDGLADGIDGGKQPLGDFLPDERDLGAIVIIRVGNVSPIFGLLHIHIRDVRGDTADVDVVHGLRPQADFPGGPDLQADRLRQPHAVVQRLEVVPGDVAIAAHGFEEILLIGDDGKPHHEKDIGSEIGNTILNVVVGAGDHGDYKNQHRNRQCYTQQG